MSDTRVERRLSATLAADVVVYCRLMGVDEEGTSPRSRHAAVNFLIPKSRNAAAASSRQREMVL
jgi:hypothetical protein